MANSRKKPTARKTSRRRTTAPKRKRSTRRRGNKKPVLATLFKLGLTGFLMFTAVMVPYTFYLDYKVRSQFEGRRWELPARVFARPQEIYNDKLLNAEALIQELKLLRYRNDSAVNAAGEYHASGNSVSFATRGFQFWDGEEQPQRVRVRFDDNSVSSIQSLDNRASVGLVRLEPVPIANIYPKHNEDRVLVRLEDVPPLLVRSLITVEDRKFYDHIGLDFQALVRAFISNLKALRTVQGGSTLTQQLVKNLFLTNERTLTRKFNEAIMALLLEWHYSKNQILEAYINEVYLGQDGKRSIHGFALASQFYFERSLNELTADQIAMLVGIVRGPSYYNPRTKSERVLNRRNLILSMLEDRSGLTASEVDSAMQQPLGVVAKSPSGVTPFPAFLEVVKDQLKRDYLEEDLRSEGLRIFTTLDPLVQIKSERAMARRLQALEKQRELPNESLQTAVVVTTVDNGEILALIGGRNAANPGYNRTTGARRPIGSLIKPFVYLTALSQPQQYTLATRISDDPLTVTLEDSNTWSPQNYDKENHGQVLLSDALTRSYNISTARLGLSVGLDKVISNLSGFELEQKIRPYPSLLLGALELTPFEVSQMYQALAAGGYKAPLTSIREVTTSNGAPLKRYPVSLEQVLEPAPAYLVTAAMHEVTRTGTARSLQHLIPESLKVAGKTGTTNGLRDSWFAGFSRDHLAVVWIGQDNNQPTGLTGASGALRVWADIMRETPTHSIDLTELDNTEWKLIDRETGLLAEKYCEDVQWMPFIQGSAPTGNSPCVSDVRNVVKKPLEWFKELWN